MSCHYRAHSDRVFSTHKYLGRMQLDARRRTRVGDRSPLSRVGVDPTAFDIAVRDGYSLTCDQERSKMSSRRGKIDAQALIFPFAIAIAALVIQHTDRQKSPCTRVCVASRIKMQPTKCRLTAYFHLDQKLTHTVAQGWYSSASGGGTIDVPLWGGVRGMQGAWRDAPLLSRTDTTRTVRGLKKIRRRKVHLFVHAKGRRRWYRSPTQTVRRGSHTRKARHCKQ